MESDQGESRQAHSRTEAEVPPRLGPRPLPLHLMAAGLTWAASRNALPLWSSGSANWKDVWQGDLGERAEALRAKLNGTDPVDFAAAVDAEVAGRLAALAKGLEAYRHHPYHRDLADPPVLWQEGACRLLDYGGIPEAKGQKDRPSVLVVPSLINRAYVLDLTAERSLLRWLARQGVRPLLMDWGRPGAEERGFTLTDYIAGRLERALDALRAQEQSPPLVLGYCMGGLLALGLALRRQDDLAGLVLLATPWDFHAENAPHSRMAAATLPLAAPLLDSLGEMPVDLLQALFSSLDPHLVVRKFLAFGRLDQGSAKARDFVALEDWLNDGVPLAGPVAAEALLGWYGENLPGRQLWRIAGRTVVPGDIGLPSKVIIPSRDRIVPPPSAEPLGGLLPHAETLHVPLGHVGMMASTNAKKAVWEPLGAWMEEYA